MAHVNLMFAKGVQLLDCDVAGLLNGTAARARHIRFSDPPAVDRDEVRALVRQAAQLARLSCHHTAAIIAVVGVESRAFAWSIKRCPLDGADPRRRG